jgi:hypothetical protein
MRIGGSESNQLVNLSVESRTIRDEVRIIVNSRELFRSCAFAAAFFQPADKRASRC